MTDDILKVTEGVHDLASAVGVKFADVDLKLRSTGLSDSSATIENQDLLLVNLNRVEEKIDGLDGGKTNTIETRYIIINNNSGGSGATDANTHSSTGSQQADTAVTYADEVPQGLESFDFWSPTRTEVVVDG